MIPTFVIFLREGVEASMIVAILLSYLDQIGQRRHFRDVFVGVGAALVLVLGGGVGAYLAIHQYLGSSPSRRCSRRSPSWRPPRCSPT